MFEGLRSGRRLDRVSVRSYAVLIALINSAMLLGLLITQRDGMDWLGRIIGSDFLSFWAAARLVAGGGSPYVDGSHLAFMRDFAPDLASYPAFFYPPSLLVFCLPLALLGYFPALALWLVATGAAYVAALRLWLTELGLPLPWWPWLLAFTPVHLTVTHGQTSFLVGALLGSGLLLAKRRPVIAGVLLGLATIKPQFGLLVPIALVMAQCWRTVLSASITALVLAAIAALAFGTAAWMDWYAMSEAATTAMSGGSIGYDKMVSVFAALKLFGATTAVASAGQGIVTAAMVGVVGWTARKHGWSPLVAAMVLAGAPLSTPFVLDYDLTLLAFPLLYLAATGYRSWEKSISALVFVAPIFARPLAIHIGVPIVPLVLLPLILVLLARARQSGDARTAEAIT